MTRSPAFGAALSGLNTIVAYALVLWSQGRTIAGTLAALQPLRARGCEVIVADGGSADATVRLARPLADAVIAADRGRARQQNAGAASARGHVLLFLHADTRLPPGSVACTEIVGESICGKGATGRLM